MKLIQNLQHNFLKMRGGSKAVCYFSESSSVSEEVGIPKEDVLLQLH